MRLTEKYFFLTLLLIGSFRYRAFTSRIKPFTICFGRIRNLPYFFSVTGAPDVYTTIRGNYGLNFDVGFVMRGKEFIPWTLLNFLKPHILLRNMLSWQWLIKSKEEKRTEISSGYDQQCERVSCCICFSLHTPIYCIFGIKNSEFYN